MQHRSDEIGLDLQVYEGVKYRAPCNANTTLKTDVACTVDGMGRMYGMDRSPGGMKDRAPYNAIKRVSGEYKDWVATSQAMDDEVKNVACSFLA